MPELWMPGAVREPQELGVRLVTLLPPRATWHATADRIDAAGYQPPFVNVATYLKRVAYCPHIMWDPVTGEFVQYYPANVGSRALSRWNEDGEVNIQIEVYFAAGALRDVNGVPTRFDTIAETPCKGLGKLLAWLDTFGIPRVWPTGLPNGYRQDNLEAWNNRPGHYAHAQVPGENHVDPGPMPSFALTGTVPLVPGLDWLQVPAS